MDASIVLCVMMLGGLVYPESEITIIPLKDDLSSANSSRTWSGRNASSANRCRVFPPLTIVNSRKSIAQRVAGIGVSDL